MNTASTYQESISGFILFVLMFEIIIVGAWCITLFVIGLVSPSPPPGPIISPILMSLLLSSLVQAYFLFKVFSENKIKDINNAKKLFIISRLFFVFVFIYYPVAEGVYFHRIENFIVIPFLYIYETVLGIASKKYMRNKQMVNKL